MDQPQEKQQSYARRDKLQAMEQEIQQFWADKEIYKAEPDNRKKFFITFPFPYANGRLHLGHAFSYTKCDFTARFKRLQGYNVLMPFAFHCTGMPISANAKRLQRDFEKLANNEKLQESSQYNTLLKMGIPEAELPKFKDPYYWIRFFPPFGKSDLQRFGAPVDWRRSFITTDANPYFNSFIEWHFTKLKEGGFIKFGKRPSIFSAQDGQMCADHDRREGEGVAPQEYILIKLRVLHPELIDASLAGKSVFLVCGTLRPETMYGQTNCFVLPTGEYGVFEMKNDELFICSERSAANMSYQDLTKEDKKVSQVFKVLGEKMIGLEVKAPLAQYEKVYVLPMTSIKMNKGTGVVTSVPSDAPDDWATLRDLQKKCEFYKIKPEWVDFKPIPIITIPKYGELAALKACDEYKIKSMNDKEQLQKAKEEVYKLGFYEGTMIIGEYKGMKVNEAKPLVKRDMIQRGEAASYYEPENTVISRGGDECVVALCDQWYITYGDKEWKQRVKDHVNTNFQAYNQTVKKELLESIDWLQEWGCSRSFGLGTKLPWDPQYLIESLSDSTIYFAFYTVVHYLQGNFDGSQPGSMNITPDQMTLETWDYLLLGKDSDNIKVSKDKLDIMRKEFLYWYPMDLRCSGKDLIKNHLIMALFNHAAVWKDQPELWPRGYFCNGHVQVDGEKMSKQLGNFKTMDDMLNAYGADATRLGCADAGDLLDDANIELKLVDSAILKLTTLDMFLSKSAQNYEKYRLQSDNANIKFLDDVFESQLNYQTILTLQAYEEMRFRDVVKNGLYVLQGNKDDYILATHAEGPRKDLILKYMELQILLLSPIASHFADFAYRNYLLPLVNKQDYPESLANYKLPDVGTLIYNANTLRQYNYMAELQRNIRVQLIKYKEQLKKQKKPEVVNKVTLVVAKDFYDWQKEVLVILNKGKIGDNGPDFDFRADIKSNPNKRADNVVKNQLQFANFVLSEYKVRGQEAIDPQIHLNEQQLITLFQQTILADIKVATLEIMDSEVAQQNANKAFVQAGQHAQPTKPTAIFE